jgi:hypothetical protein
MSNDRNNRCFAILEHIDGNATSVARLSRDRSISKFDLTLSSKFLKVLPIQGSVTAHHLLHIVATAHDSSQQMVQVVEQGRNAPSREVAYAAFGLVVSRKFLVFCQSAEASFFRFCLLVSWFQCVYAGSARKPLRQLKAVTASVRQLHQ